MKSLFLFNPVRFLAIVRLDLAAASRPLSIIAAGALAIALLAGMAGTGVGDGFFGILLFIGGILVTSAACADLHEPRSCAAHLLLPASVLEKFSSRALLSSIGFAAGSVAAVWLCSFAASEVTQLARGAGTPIFSPLRESVWKSVCSYLSLQSVFLLGAYFFRKHAFIKTVLAVALLFLGFAVIAGTLFHLGLFESLKNGLVFSTAMNGGFSNSPVLSALETWVMPPILWVLAFWRFARTTA
jgi:hypothetical protein